MMRISTIAFGVTAVGVIGAGVALALRDTAEASDARTGVYWQHDAALPSVHRGGAAQAAWAAAAVGNLDSDSNGRLDAADGRAIGAWSSNARVVTALIDRYDTDHDDAIGVDEAAQLGADVATDGWLTAAAVRDLRADLGA